MVPFGVVPLHYWWAFGLRILLNSSFIGITMGVFNNVKAEDKAALDAMIFLAAWLSLGIGFLVHRMM